MNQELLMMFERRDQGLCPMCGKPSTHTPFTSEISKREHEISGICNPCQEVVFNEDN